MDLCEEQEQPAMQGLGDDGGEKANIRVQMGLDQNIANVENAQRWSKEH